MLEFLTRNQLEDIQCTEYPLGHHLTRAFIGVCGISHGYKGLRHKLYTHEHEQDYENYYMIYHYITKTGSLVMSDRQVYTRSFPTSVIAIALPEGEDRVYVLCEDGTQYIQTRLFHDEWNEWVDYEFNEHDEYIEYNDYTKFINPTTAQPREVTHKLPIPPMSTNLQKTLFKCDPDPTAILNIPEYIVDVREETSRVTLIDTKGEVYWYHSPNRSS